MKRIKTALQKLIFFTTPLMFIMASCEDELIGPVVPNTPTQNFETFWKTFDTHYGLFEVKGINWDDTFKNQRPKINDQMSDAQLYQVFIEMINPLNDNHLNIYPTNGELPVYPGGIFSYKNGVATIAKVQEDFDKEVAKKYLISHEQVTPAILYGKLPNNLGYIAITGTDGLNEVKKQMGKVMAALADAKGIVVDVRGFYGGYDPVSQFLAGCFASSKKLYMTTRKRNGPAHTQFTEPLQWYVEPQTGNSYTRPVLVLTSQFTQSAGETFVLAVNQFDHVQLIGDTTAGSFSDNPNFELPNGWIFSVSVGDYRDANGVSYEGTGLTPDFAIRTNKENLLAGRDIALEKAVEMLDK